MAGDLPHLFSRSAVLVVTFLLSGFFSGSETALFCFQPHELSRMREGGRLDRIVAALRDRPKRLLTTVLFGNMVVNVVFFSVSYLMALDLRPRVGGAGTFLLSAGALLAIVVGGEVMPKSFAVIFYRPIGRVVALPLYVLQKALVVLIVPLSKLADFAASLVGGGGGRELRPEELQMLVSLGAREGVLEAGAGRMISEVISLSDVHIRELMVPRVDMVSFNLEDPEEDLQRLFREEKLTMIPVYEGELDNIRGVIHIKDVLFRDPGKSLQELVRPIAFLPETATVEEALRQCRKEASKTAFVVDEYGSVEGLITVEDLLEEIVGEIADEYDVRGRPDVAMTSDGQLQVRGGLPLRDWEELFGVSLPEADVDTVGGLVMALLDRVPRQGDTVCCRGVEFTVETVSGRRVEALRARFLSEESGDGCDDS